LPDGTIVGGMEPTERRAIVLLLVMGVVGQGVRWAASRPGEPPGQVALMPVERRSSPLAHRDSAAAAARPLGEGETVDPDRATAQELLRLPRVGPALARAIVADREARGPFRDLKGFDRVPGVGPKLLGVLAPHLRFEPGAGVAPGAPSGCGAGVGACLPDLNQVSAAELEAIPGIGPALAGRILLYRESHGGFADIGELEAVPGIGPALAGRLREHLRVP